MKLSTREKKKEQVWTFNMEEIQVPYIFLSKTACYFLLNFLSYLFSLPNRNSFPQNNNNNNNNNDNNSPPKRYHHSLTPLGKSVTLSHHIYLVSAT